MDEGSKQFFTMMEAPQNIQISDYTYNLPDERIAALPLPERDASKLLVHKDGVISESIYKNIDAFLPKGCLLVFNNTRVINARILFQKATGGTIEIFCLEPGGTISEYSSVMSQTGNSTWKCMIGGASKWKEGPLIKQLTIQDTVVTLEVRLIEKLADAYKASFSWQPAHFSFAEIIAAAGDVPLPPYIKRETTGNDTERYQTIYAQWEGSVAAPTAGLHFTGAIFEKLANKNISHEFITLHVGAGTFKPVKAATMQGHLMHSEWIDVSAVTISNLSEKLKDGIIAVGTTSLRTLESLYWLGVKAQLQPDADALQLAQWDVYEAPLCNTTLTPVEALRALLHWLQQRNMTALFTQTQLLITPGYRFHMVRAIITNFHQPQSTLLLLVAAAIGPGWRSIYEYALDNDFRFLSYGDGSLLFITQEKS
jgi:S-adenosylmethionine:tRNA ribosyltransferase-isomerase